MPALRAPALSDVSSYARRLSGLTRARQATASRPQGLFITTIMNPEDRFEAGAPAYADYLRTVEGRLRLDLAWANLRAVLDERAAHESCAAAGGGPMRAALDLGGGTGALAVRLAALGYSVAVVDSSTTMIELAREAARQAGVLERLSFHQADAARAAGLFAPESFDVATCHNVLEYVPDPAAAVRALRKSVRSQGGIVSLLVRQRAGEALRHALKGHDLDHARRALDAEWATESLYGGPARVFDSQSLRALLDESGLELIAERGVRVVADYLPPALTETEAAYARLLAFELALGARPEFAAVARYRQVLARVRRKS